VTVLEEVAPDDEVLALLRSWEAGERWALAELMPLVCGDLHRIASSLLRREAAGVLLEPDTLVSELYLRLHALRAARWESLAHFYNTVVCLMRQILVDQARTARRRKRGRGVQHLPLENATDLAAAAGSDPRALSDALLDLRRSDPQRFKVVALRCFVGLTAEETAATCGVSLSTVKRDWRLARTWLQQALGAARPGPAIERRPQAGERLRGRTKAMPTAATSAIAPPNEKAARAPL